MAKRIQMTSTQAETARRILASADGLLRPYPGGYWTTVRDGRREAWWTRILTVRAMQAHGWLERCRERPESWLDARRLTEAGKAALVQVGKMPGDAADGLQRCSSSSGTAS